jgi:signal transduction histidine kinase
VNPEERLRSRRRKAGRPRRPSGAREVAALALDHLGALIGVDAGWVIRSATPGLERLAGQSAESLTGRSLSSLLDPDTADSTIEQLAQAIQADRRMAVRGRLAGDRSVVFIPAPTPEPSAEIYLLVTDTVGDTTRAAETAEVFRARLVEVEEQLADVALLSDVTEDISTSLDPGLVLPRIAEHALRLCRAQAVGVETLDRQRTLLQLVAFAEIGRGEVSAPAVPPDATLAGRALVAGTTLELIGDDAERHGARYAAGQTARYRAILAVPLLAGGAAQGAIVLCRTAGRPFSALEVLRARKLARRAALVVRNVRAHAELRHQLAEVQHGQAELIEAEKVAALGKLGAGAAHEINNPLAAIVGNAELLLRRESLTPGARERVDRILEAAYRAARVIRQLLMFVRPQAPDTTPTDLVRVLRQVVAERTGTRGMDAVRLLDEMEAVPAVAADGRQLAQVFGNILDNALDAVKTTTNGHDRTIRLTSHSLPGRVRIGIENSGLPIADESLPRIFDPFYTTKPVGQGAGLGLSVCRGIVSAHGGRIVAENLSDGVAILVDLPVVDAAPLT